LEAFDPSCAIHFLRLVFTIDIPCIYNYIRTEMTTCIEHQRFL